MTSFVLDNSVSMRWFFDAGEHARADAILEELAKDGSEALVPVIWRYEVSAVLSRAQIKGMIPGEEVARFVEDLAALPIHLDEDSANLILTGVHSVAIAYRLTSYDAAYLELALRRGLPLATLDDGLLAACAESGVKTV